MGFYDRKSVSLGSFRVNVGKSGVDDSVGGKSVRTGVSGKGKCYTTYSDSAAGLCCHDEEVNISLANTERLWAFDGSRH